MTTSALILISEAVAMYLLVLWVHSLRTRIGLEPFYALLGGITAIMSWVTDAGVQVEIAGVTFMVGSTVFYTALLLGVFVVYVFDGPPSTRIAILTIAGVSILVPVIAGILHTQMILHGQAPIGYVPFPSVRINSASVLATIADFVFLAIAWEFLGKPLRTKILWLRAFLTLLGVLWLDVLLFNTGAFAGTPNYLSILSGTFLSRLFISVFAGPFLYLYLNWQYKRVGHPIDRRPVLAILKEFADIRTELRIAKQEIARRKEIETALRENEAKLKNILDHTTNLFYTHDTNHVLTFLSPHIKDILGYTVEEAKRKWTTFASDNPVNERGYELTMKAIETGERQQPYELELIHKTGRKVWVEVREAPVVMNGKTVSIVGSLTDITERKHALNLLEASERRFRALIEHGSDVITCVNSESVIIYVSPAVERILGYPKHELLGRSFLSLIHDGDKENSKTLFQNGVSNTKEVIRWEYRLKHCNGEWRNLESVAKNLLDDVALNCIIINSRDITEQRRREEELIVAKERAEQADRFKDAFIANISHEIRTPLNIIFGVLDILRTSDPLTLKDELDSFHGSIERSGKRLMRMISDILSISLFTSGSYKPHYEAVNVMEKIEPLIRDLQPIAQGKNLRLEFHGDSGEARIDADAYSLVQAVSNLLDNALKFTYRGFVRVRVWNDASTVKVSVADSGIGIDKEYLPLLYQEFTQELSESGRPYEGVGLGMALVKRYVAINKGQIEVHSEKSEGTEFILTFPLVTVASLTKQK